MSRNNDSGCLVFIIIAILAIMQFILENKKTIMIILGVIFILGIIIYIFKMDAEEEKEKLRKKEEEEIEKKRDYYKISAYRFQNILKRYKEYGLGISGVISFSTLVLKTCNNLSKFYVMLEEDILIDYENYINYTNIESSEKININSFDFPLEFAMEIYYNFNRNNIDITNTKLLKLKTESYLIKKYFDDIDNEDPFHISEADMVNVLAFTMPKKLEELYGIWFKNKEIIEKIKMKREIESPGFENKVAKELDRFEYMTKEEILSEALIYHDLVKNGHRKRDIIKEYAYSKFNEVKDDIY